MPLLLIEVQEFFCFTLGGCFVLFVLAELLKKQNCNFRNE